MKIRDICIIPIYPSTEFEYISMYICNLIKQISVVVKMFKCGLLRAQISHRTFTFIFCSYQAIASSFLKIYQEAEVNSGVTKKGKDKPVTQSLGYITQLERCHGQDRNTPFSPRLLRLSTFH